MSKLSGYQDEAPRQQPPSATANNMENELDSLIGVMKRRAESPSNEAIAPPSPLQALRELTVNELVPVFVELVEKYSKSGISLQMDASNFLEGGREMKFEFASGEYRTELHGTVTSEGIAFHEVRYTPDFHGELATGPLLRIRQLNATTFREFICDRLTQLLRIALRRR